jgi:hypothetical protein
LRAWEDLRFGSSKWSPITGPEWAMETNMPAKQLHKEHWREWGHSFPVSRNSTPPRSGNDRRTKWNAHTTNLPAKPRIVPSQWIETDKAPMDMDMQAVRLLVGSMSKTCALYWGFMLKNWRLLREIYNSLNITNYWF